MLEKIILKNYRNLHLNQGLAFDPLTIFVGANGAGKTNLIRVLRFLQEAWVGSEDERRGVSRFEGAVARWGSGNILDKSLDTPAVVSIETYFQLQQGYQHGFQLDLDIKDENSVLVRKETLQSRSLDIDPTQEGFKFYDVNLATNQNRVSRFREEPHRRGQTKFQFKKDQEALPANELAVHSLQKWLEENSQAPSKDTPFFEGKRWIEEFIREWAFYDTSQMNVEAIRRARPEIGSGDRTLTQDGSNLALVLFNLSQASIDFTEQIERAMQELFPLTRKLRPSVVGRVSLTVEWYQQGIDRPFYLDEMSEGTVRMLCWAAVLFSPRIPSLLVIDEPEASLHPAWLRVLAGWIREASRRTQIIISTHSPDLLDYFTEELSSLRVFGSCPNSPNYMGVHTIQPQDVEEKIAEGWRLGDLYRVGDPQIGGWPW